MINIDIIPEREPLFISLITQLFPLFLHLFLLFWWTHVYSSFCCTHFYITCNLLVHPLFSKIIHSSLFQVVIQCLKYVMVKWPWKIGSLILFHFIKIYSWISSSLAFQFSGFPCDLRLKHYCDIFNVDLFSCITSKFDILKYIPGLSSKYGCGLQGLANSSWASL